MKRKLVYLAGPLTSGNPFSNVNRAVAVADFVWASGGAPLIPHLSALWEMTSNRRYTYEDMMEIDFAYIGKCDALYRFAGASPGADREVQFAARNGVKVFHQGEDDVKFVEYLRADLD